ncbi:hypothetical protein EDD22DRAFT_908904 [Suillus occidentalis]|nr:hypothetical protein EDD22DRAFT_908904 [Suillus occidentalis]
MPRANKAKRTQSKLPTPFIPFKRSDSELAARGWGPHRYTSVTNPLPDNESAKRFPVSDHITGRLMELKENRVHIVEFLDPDGERVANDDLELLEKRMDGSFISIPEARLFPSLPLYFLASDDRVFEVHFGHRLICTISFPRRSEVVLHDTLASQSELPTTVT